MSKPKFEAGREMVLSYDALLTCTYNGTPRKGMIVSMQEFFPVGGTEVSHTVFRVKIGDEFRSFDSRKMTDVNVAANI